MLTVFYCTDRIVLHLDAEVPKEERPDTSTTAKKLGIADVVKVFVFDAADLSMNEQRDLYESFSSRRGTKLLGILHQVFKPFVS